MIFILFELKWTTLILYFNQVIDWQSHKYNNLKNRPSISFSSSTAISLLLIVAGTIRNIFKQEINNPFTLPLSKLVIWTESPMFHNQVEAFHSLQETTENLKIEIEMHFHPKTLNFLYQRSTIICPFFSICNVFVWTKISFGFAPFGKISLKLSYKMNFVCFITKKDLYFSTAKFLI